jgi:hypothetical protein
MSGGHGHVEGGNKKIALLVAVLAALLAISEMGGKSAQTHGLADHIDASNLWSFFQAKTIRQTTMRTAADAIEAQFKDAPQPMPAGLKGQVDAWRKTAQRYETEPETNEGRKELAARPRRRRPIATSRWRLITCSNTARQRCSLPSCWLARPRSRTSCG